MANEKDLLIALPRRLRIRLESIGSYVTAIVHELDAPRQKANRLKREQIQQIQLVVFIYALDHLLQEGTNAAIGAVDTFKALGLGGFSVGSTSFAERNRNVNRGQELSLALRSAIENQELLNLIDNARGIGSLIRESYEEVRRGQ